MNKLGPIQTNINTNNSNIFSNLDKNNSASFSKKNNQQIESFETSKEESLNIEKGEISGKKVVYKLGNFVDDILNSIKLIFDNSVTKSIGINCFKSVGLESIPKENEIDDVRIFSNYIEVTLATGENYKFNFDNNIIKLSDCKDKNGTHISNFYNFDGVINIRKIKDGYAIDTKNGITYNYKLEKLQRFKKIYNEKTKTFIETNEIEEYYKYIISSINNNDDFLQFHNNLEDTDEYVKNFIKLYCQDDIKINGYTTHTVSTKDGLKTYKVFYLGSTKQIDEFLYTAEHIYNTLDIYPENIKNYIGNSKFEGFIYTTPDDINNIGTWSGFAHCDKFVCLHNPSYVTVFHEMGHIIDCSIGSSDSLQSYNSYYDQELSSLYEKHKKNLQKLENVRYKNEGGIPNKLEFFAELSNVYFTQNKELKVLLPDCYNYIKNIYDNL